MVVPCVHLPASSIHVMTIPINSNTNIYWYHSNGLLFFFFSWNSSIRLSLHDLFYLICPWFSKLYVSCIFDDLYIFFLHISMSNLEKNVDHQFGTHRSHSFYALFWCHNRYKLWPMWDVILLILFGNYTVRSVTVKRMPFKTNQYKCHIKRTEYRTVVHINLNKC